MHEDNSPTEAGRLPGLPQPAGPALSLLVMARSGVRTLPLPEDVVLTIGRAESCDIQLDDPKVSRQHARLHLRSKVEIEDLGSVNGTLVNGLPVEPKSRAALIVGDMLTAGSTVLILQPLHAGATPAPIWSEEAFASRLEKECLSDAPFAVMRVRLHHPDLDLSSASTQDSLSKLGPMMKEAEAVLRDLLRPQDVIATHASGGYEVLLPQTPPDMAEAMAAHLLERYRERGLSAEVGVACFPRDGRSVRTLETRALDRSTSEPPPSMVEAPRHATPMAKLQPLLERVAAGEINVLILGETGVGKEVTARAIHDRSRRSSGPMVCLNCAAFSESLLESELFGYERGAFTGATQAKPGLIEAANGGSVFLDEIGEMPQGLQAKLLRVLEQREVQRLGALRPRAFDVRFIAATNRDLEREIAAGRFREDLYFRVNGISITIPPLRERLDELENLANQFVASAAQQSRRPRVPRISGQVLALMKRYAWPGNIRELRNAMERAVLLSSGDIINLEHVPSEKWAPIVPAGSRGAVSAVRIAAPRVAMPPVEELTHPGLEPVFAGLSGRERIVAALEACQGNQTNAAKLLGVSRRTLITRIEEYGLPRPRKKDGESE